jgi:hypothetical protein
MHPLCFVEVVSMSLFLNDQIESAHFSGPTLSHKSWHIVCAHWLLIKMNGWVGIIEFHKGKQPFVATPIAGDRLTLSSRTPCAPKQLPYQKPPLQHSLCFCQGNHKHLENTWTEPENMLNPGAEVNYKVSVLKVPKTQDRHREQSGRALIGKEQGRVVPGLLCLAWTTCLTSQTRRSQDTTDL